ncbi:MAG: hypothetical protein J6Z38_01310 [Lachnospiraceae bacterium]|nr:hypothetical protein [Lachnospiraceae bacterium]
MTRFLSSVLFLFVFCAMLPACKLSDTEIEEMLGLNDPGEPADLTVEQLIKHMDAATDPEGNFKNAKSYILRQVIVEESQKDVDDNPFTQRTRTSVDQYESEIKFRKPDFERQISYRNGEPFASLLFKEGRAWTIDPKKSKATEITGHQLRLFYIFNSFSHPNKNLEDVFSTIEISTVYLRGARHYRVVYRADDVEIAPYVMYVNPNTFITTKMETILYTDDGQEFHNVALPDRFEKRSGVLMPTITKTTIGEDRHEVILLREFELNVTFSDDVFQVPDEKIKIGRRKD